jgi:hypothetical protein
MRRWLVYLIGRLLFVTFTIIIFEVASITQVPDYLYLALLPTIGALLIPYGKPRKRYNPENFAGIATTCAVVLAVAIWPYYCYATATAPSTPTAITATETFTFDQNSDTTQGCIGLVDNQQRHWLTGLSLLSSVKNNEVILYDTAYGWTPVSHPTQSPTPFFNNQHLNQVGYTLSPVTPDSPLCQISRPSRYGG